MKLKIWSTAFQKIPKYQISLKSMQYWPYCPSGQTRRS